MMSFSQEFDQTLSHFGISARWIANESGVSEVIISKFRNGKKEVQTDTLSKLIGALPSEVQEYYFGRLLGTSIHPKKLDIENFISDIDHIQLAALLSAIATKLRKVESAEVIPL